MSNATRRREAANKRHNTIKDEDITLLQLGDVHSAFKMVKAKISVCHGVVASQHDDWRAKANRRPKQLVRKMGDPDTPVLSIR